MFQHQGAILRGFIKKKDYKYNMYLGASGTWHFYVFYGDTEAHVWGVADKSLAPPERKLQQPNSGCIQHTPPKLSTLLSPLFQLLPATQKKFRILSVQTGLRGSNDLPVGWKMATYQLFFQSRVVVVVRRG